MADRNARKDQTMPATLFAWDAAAFAMDKGSVFEYRGLVSLTGAGAYHSRRERGSALPE